jgi:outer membrane receptor protein involved in Fe transport
MNYLRGLKKTSLIILTFFMILSWNSSFAQKTAELKGNLLDKKEAIEFADISLARLPDSSKVVYFTNSDSLGKFLIDKIAFGNYLLKISLIGYQPTIQTIALSEENPVLTFNNLQIKTDDKLLNEVVVRSQKKLIEKTSEGFIVNASANIAQIGGTATDLLKSTPTVSVDADGVITLRGKTPLILINGRNSKLANADQIPASSIESIEIINNASAKYDANAQSGIINIRLKKNTDAGTNGAIVLGLGAGSRARATSSVLFNHKAGKWNLGMGYDNRFAGRTKHITGNRTNFNSPDFYQINQDRLDERFERLQNLRLNVDFLPNDKNSLSFEAIGSTKGQDNDESLNSLILKQNKAFNSGNDRHSLELQNEKVAEFALNFNRKFINPEKTLAVGITTSLEKAKENTDITTQNLNEGLAKIGNQFLQKTHTYENSQVSNAMLDYSFPIFKKGTIETGYKGTLRSVTNDYEASDKVANVYVINAGSTNIFKFNEQIHALYALYHDFIGKEESPKWKYELGLRAEKVSNNGKTNTNSTNVANNYQKLFPTANISYLVGVDEFWKLSYAKRINRPDLDEFNPFVDITDALNPHSGNPNLKPEIIQALELGYNKEWDNFTFSSTVFYRHSENTIRNFMQPLANGVVMRLPVNIGTANSYGLENMITAKPSNFYNLNASVSLFQQKFDASNISTEAVQNSFNWFAKLINNISVSKGGKLQIIGNYNSAATTPQGRLIPLYNIDLGFQQKLGKGNARLGLVVVDVFNTLASGSNSTTAEFKSIRTQKADTRAIMLTFAYSFKSVFKEKLMENKFSREF